MTHELRQQCATGVMDTFHTMIRTVGPEARKQSSTELSMQQFRTMRTIERHQGASLSLVSEHLGSTLSATSKLVDGLVERGFIRRETAEDDRRRLLLALTDAGMQIMECVHMRAITCLADKLGALSPNECAVVNVAMDILRSALVSETAGRTTTE
jgi:DNA-binding MarR family transcriptional regulator